MSALESLDWSAVRRHYEERYDVHARLIKLHDAGKADAFAALLLGVSDPGANYSASEHGLGPKILGSNPDASKRVSSLASDFRNLKKATDVPNLIQRAGLKFLKIGVGSEASCMMNPTTCWVANTRSIWTHLVIKHADDFGKANEELKLYQSSEISSEMHYPTWSSIHRSLDVSLTRIAKEGTRLAVGDDVEPGSVTFLWADAIANELYAQHHT